MAQFLRAFTTFQFQNGTIKEAIPKKIGNFGTKFQFQNGTITSSVVLLMSEPCCMFQFQNGTIQRLRKRFGT